MRNVPYAVCWRVSCWSRKANAIALIFARHAGVQPTHARERAAGNVGAAKVLLKPDIAAELHADVSTGDVVEAYAVQGAYLHVFDQYGRTDPWIL